MEYDAAKPADDLGPLLKEFKTSLGNYWFLTTISACVILFLLLLFFAEFKNQKSLSEDGWMFLTIAVIALVPFAVVVYQRGNVARFYEFAVVYENRRSIKTAYWAEICDVWEWCARVNISGAPTPGQFFNALRTVDGMVIRFPPRLDDIEGLRRFLQSEAARWGVPVRTGVPPMKNSLGQFVRGNK